MTQRPMFEQIPPLLRPQNCSGHVYGSDKSPTPPPHASVERPCPDPAEWFSTATGSPLCEKHMLTLKTAQHQREITPP